MSHTDIGGSAEQPKPRTKWQFSEKIILSDIPAKNSLKQKTTFVPEITIRRRLLREGLADETISDSLRRVVSSSATSAPALLRR